MDNIKVLLDNTVKSRIDQKVVDYSVARQDVGQSIRDLADLSLLFPNIDPLKIYPKNWLGRTGYSLFLSINDNVYGDTTNAANWQVLVTSGGKQNYSITAYGFGDVYESTDVTLGAYSTSHIYITTPDVPNTTTNPTFEVNALGYYPIKKYVSGSYVNLSIGDFAGTLFLVFKGYYFLIVGSISGGSTAFNGNRVITKPGIPGLTGQNLGGNTIAQFLEGLFPATAPYASINGYSLQEKGTSFTPTITGSISVYDGTITARRIKRNGTVINTPAGNSISFVDTAQTANTVYTIEADYTMPNATTGMTTQSTTLSFVSPSYAGVWAVGLNEAGVKAFTKTLRTVRNGAVSYSPVNQRYYYVYPASLGDLTVITDPNQFNITTGFIKTTATYTLADGATTEPMNIYTNIDDTTQTGFTISFN